MLMSWDRQDEGCQRCLHLLNSQGLCSTSFKPKVSKAFHSFRNGSLLSQLSTLPVATYDTESQDRRFLVWCGIRGLI